MIHKIISEGYPAEYLGSAFIFVFVYEMKKTAIIVSLMLTMSLAGCGSSSSKTISNEQSDKTISSAVEKDEESEKVTTDADENAGTVDSDTLIATVREAIDGTVGEGETITDVSFDGTNLNIVVDMSGVTDSPLPVEIIAESRVNPITDEILALDDSYYNTWETVTVDFGDIGRIVCDKSMVKDEGYGKFFEVPLGVFDN